MKQLFILMTAAICALSVNAQQNDTSKKETFSHLQISVNGGIASPLGNFSKGVYSNERSGFAKTGGAFNLTGTWSFTRHFGIGVLAGYSKFGYKGSQSLSDGYKEDSGTDSTTLYQKGSNHALSFLIGPVYRIVDCKKIAVTVRVLGGYTRTHLAGFQVFYEDYTENAMSQREASGGAFGLQAGLGLQYHISNKLSVLANADYFVSKPNIAITYDNFIVNSGRRLRSYNESITGINATVGVAYTLF